MSVVAFIIGLYTGLAVVAASYRVIDVWFCIRDEYADVLKRYLRAGLAVIVLVWLIPAEAESAFFWGMTTFVIIHFSAFYAIQALVVVVTRRRSR